MLCKVPVLATLSHGFNRLKGAEDGIATRCSPNSPSGGSKTLWTVAPELSEAPSARWPGQYSAFAKKVISLTEDLPYGQRCGPVRAYGRLAPSFPGRRIRGVLRTPATKLPNVVLPFFSHLKLSGVAGGLCFATGKNSAPRARRPQPRRNAGQSAGARSKCLVAGQNRVRLRPTRPKRLKQLAAVKTQPPSGHPFSWFQPAEGGRRWDRDPVFTPTRLPAGARRRRQRSRTVFCHFSFQPSKISLGSMRLILSLRSHGITPVAGQHVVAPDVLEALRVHPGPAQHLLAKGHLGLGAGRVVVQGQGVG